MRAMTSGLLLTAALLAIPAAGTAQDAPATDGRWQAWIGCWQPVGATGTRAVCVLPAGPSAVELVTVEDGKVAGRERVDAGGEARPSTREACAGTERGRWSPDGRRVYLRSEHACDGVRFRSTGLLAIAPTGEWIDVRGVSVAGGPADVRVRRYQLLVNEALLPAELRAQAGAALSARPTVRMAARANAAADIVPAHVAEAVREVDEGVVEAWLMERGEGFDLDGKQLVALDRAGVPGRVIDVMVALTYPSRFALGGTTRDVAERAVDSIAPRTGTTDTVRVYDLSQDRRMRYCRDGRLPLSYCDDYLLGYGASPYGYSPYGYSPYGYSPWGVDAYGYGYGYYRRPPVIVITNPGEATERGRVVKGKGYTRSGSSSSGGTAEPRTRSGTSTTSGDRTSTTRSSGGSSRGSETRSSGGSERSGGSSESGRKARPRNP